MDSKGTNNTPIRSDSLLYNEDYFKYIFKKTEKILSAVLYTTRSLSDEHQKDILVRTIEDKSIALLTLLERTLTVGRASQVRLFEEFRVALIALEGALTMLTAGRVMREDLLEVFRHELSTLHRSLRDYIHDTPPHPFESPYDIGPRISEKRHTPISRVRMEGVSGKSEIGVGTPTTSRRDRILNIIKDKGQVTIKDVSTAVTDCSEKTIQRELMSLISEGRIVKEGERRWSKYSLVGV